jgi:transglutaminase-like putative cysteine protease
MGQAASCLIVNGEEMDRRSFIKTAAALSAISLSPFSGAAERKWRTFEVTTRVELANSGPATVWLPVPTVNTDYQAIAVSAFKADGANARIVQDPKYGAGILVAEFGESAKPMVELTSRFSTRDRMVDWSSAIAPAPLDRAERDKYLEPTDLLPTDGIVRQTALEITKGARSDLEKSRAIYDWIVDNAHRDPKVRGCGVGDIKAMLETGNLGGKCGDLNALFVGLARAVGVPARDVYGIRVADSQLGYRSLGKSGDVTKAQHCRAEFYSTAYGWIPVDPADVTKVVLEENGGLPLSDVKVETARKRLFGSWEMNWLALNYAHDVQLPSAQKGKLGFFMYPNAEVMDQGKIARMDSLDPENFVYTITSREIVA